MTMRTNRFTPRCSVSAIALAFSAFLAAACNAQCAFSPVTSTPKLTTDALVLTRYMNGVRDEAQLFGGTPRNSATLESVRAYVAANACKLDLDGSGRVELNDVLLAQRHLAGLRNDALANGLTLNTPRNTGALVQQHIEDGCPVVATTTCTVAGDEPQIASLLSKTIVSSGLERNYLLYTPANLPAGPAPLVVVLHGGSQDAAVTASETLPTFAWRTIADREKILVAFPNGLSNQWNDCRSDKTNRSTANDSRFVSDVIDSVSAQRSVDSSRIYATGSSNGGMMTYRVALDLAAKFAGIGAVIANLPVDPLQVCSATPPNAMSVVIMNGTSDPLMPYEGGGVAMSTTSGTVRSADATRDFWVTANGCSTTAAIENLPDIVAADGVTITRETYSGCRGNHKVAFFRAVGGGHTMPSLRYFTSGRQSRDIEGAEEIWKVLRDARAVR
jgi:polyhydroxybutyrate depolymerase